MKNAKRVVAGLCVLASIFTVLSMGGCLYGDVRGDDRGRSHYYRDGRWYRHDPSGTDIIVGALAIGALIEDLPPSHTTVVIKGNQYYHDDNYYYRPASRGGYVVVRPPAQPRSRGNQDKKEEKRGNPHDDDHRR